jgi:hypothetical protein
MGSPCDCPTPANKAAFISGVDGAGNPVALIPKPGGILYNADGSVAAKWADGSVDHPIRTPGMLKSSKKAETVMVMDPSGKWYRLQPQSTENLQWLVSRGGAMGFEDIINERLTRFPAASLDAPTCEYTIATFTQCEGGNVAKIARVSLEDFAEKIKPFLIEEEDDSAVVASCLTALTGLNGAVSSTLVAGADQMIISCAGEGETLPCWKAVPAGLMYYPLTTPKAVWVRPAAGGSASSDQTVLLPDFPTKLCPSRKIVAALSAGIGSNAGSFSAAVLLNEITVAQVQGDSSNDSGFVPVVIADNGQLRIRTAHYGGSAFGWSAGVILHGYYR